MEELLDMFGDTIDLLSYQEQSMLQEAARKGTVTFKTFMRYLKEKHATPEVVTKATEVLDSLT